MRFPRILNNTCRHLHTQNRLSSRLSHPPTVSSPLPQKNPSVAFWNAEGLRNFYNVDSSFAEKLTNYDILGVLETWQDHLLPKQPSLMADFNFIQIPATRNFNIGRASGGIMLFIRKGPIFEKLDVLATTDYYIIFSTFIEGTKILLGLAYLNPCSASSAEIDDLLDAINTLTLREPDIPFLLLGDLNGRMGNLNQVDPFITDGTALSYRRSSLDVEVNRRGKDLDMELSSMGFILLNGRTPSDTPACLTFLRQDKQSSVDVVWANRSSLHLIKDTKVIPHGTLSPHLL